MTFRAVKILGLFAVVLAALLCSVASAGAAASASWTPTSRMVPSNLAPGGEGTIFVQASNTGDAFTSGNFELSDQLPAGVTVQSVEFFSTSVEEAKNDLAVGNDPFGFGEPVEHCSVSAQRVGCQAGSFNPFFKTLEPELREVFEQITDVPPLYPFGYLEMRIKVKAEPGAATGNSKVQVIGGAPAAAISQPVKVSAEQVSFGVEAFNLVPEEERGAIDTQAGSHPFQLTTTIALNQRANTLEPPGVPRHLRFQLPTGFLGNTTVLKQCDDLDFRHVVEGGTVDLCPADTAVGVVNLTVNETHETTFTVPIFNLVPKQGEPARFGFEVIGIPVTLDTSVRTGSDYGVNVDVNNISELANFISSTVTLWGVPGDSSHNESRGWGCLAGGKYAAEAEVSCDRSSESNPPPFLTMPTSCGGAWTPTVEGESWPLKATREAEAAPVSFGAAPYKLIDGFGRELGVSGCNKLPFGPALEVSPDGEAASTPTGLAVKVNVPQEVNGNGAGLESSSVKDIAVTFPEGVTVNPASADGLEACSEGQIGFEAGHGVNGSGFEEFNPVTEPGSKTALFTPSIGNPFCPTASKIGTVKIKVPVIKSPLNGSLYLAAQNANPFGSLVAAYIVAKDEESGVVVKLPGEVSLNPVTGQISTTFENSPQAPLEEAEIHLFGGAQAPFSTPSHCGAYTTDATFTPWSGGAPIGSSSSFKVTSGPNGSACPPAALPFTPSLQAGTTNINAGAFSPFVTTIGREDGNQNIDAVQLHTPPGLSGILTGIPLCPEAQANAGTCSQASLIGHTTVSVGLGNEPFTVVGGEVFLTEKYAGAPFGLSIVNPAVAGPFNLGKVIVRAKIEVDPHTAALTVTTGEIPHILDGIPLQIKHVNVTIDRPGFTFNPTNCGKTSITGNIGSVEGAGSPVAAPFQVTNCAALKFAPKFAVATSGKTSKAKGASLHVKLTYPQGPVGTYANIARVKVDLPKQLPSRLTTLQKACTNAQFEANPAGCPQASIIGHAKAVTPLIPVPLEGPAYFVSHGGEAFPSLIMVLQGYGVKIDLVGTTFISKAGITSSTFKTVPDQPIGSFELTLPQGKYSALAANGNLCTSKLAMPTEFLAQNGAKINDSTKISVTGCKKTKKTAKQTNKNKPKAKKAGSGLDIGSHSNRRSN